jgi:hypothetical protein
MLGGDSARADAAEIKRGASIFDVRARRLGLARACADVVSTL